MSDGRHAEAIHRGAAALDAALAGESSAWSQAEAAYGEAARASLLDTYPLWVLELMQSWRSASPSTAPADPAVAPFIAAIRSLDYGAALSLAEALEVPRSRELATRLARDLLSAQAKR